MSRPNPPSAPWTLAALLGAALLAGCSGEEGGKLDTDPIGPPATITTPPPGSAAELGSPAPPSAGQTVDAGVSDAAASSDALSDAAPSDAASDARSKSDGVMTLVLANGQARSATDVDSDREGNDLGLRGRFAPVEGVRDTIEMQVPATIGTTTCDGDRKVELHRQSLVGPIWVTTARFETAKEAAACAIKITRADAAGGLVEGEVTGTLRPRGLLGNGGDPRTFTVTFSARRP